MDLHSITKVSFSQVVGLAEAVDEAGGQADVARIAAEVEMDLDRIGPIVAAFALHFGTYQSEDLFRALVYWGRYSELVAYDSRSEQLSLRVPGVRIPSAH